MQNPQIKRENLRKIFKAYIDESKVPIILQSANKKIKMQKPLIFVIDPDSSFIYFSNTVHKKLQYIGALKSQQIFYYCNGFQLTNSYSTMGDIFDKYKTQQGWLQIKIQGDSSF